MESNTGNHEFCLLSVRASWKKNRICVCVTECAHADLCGNLFEVYTKLKFVRFFTVRCYMRHQVEENLMNKFLVYLCYASFDKDLISDGPLNQKRRREVWTGDEGTGGEEQVSEGELQ